MDPRTTVVIVNWNGAQFLPALLNSISSITRPAIVIDNASTDSSLDVLKSRQQITVIQNTENVGFGSAANQGFKLAQTDFVLLLNADVEVSRGAIDLLETFLDQHPEADIVAPRLVFSDGSLQLSCRRFPTIFRLFMYLSFLDRIFPTRYRLKAEEHGATREVEQPMGAALMIRKSALDAHGGFDERFFMYMEDVDLCERIHKAGGKIYFYPDAKIVHAAGGSSKQDWKRSQQNFIDSLLLYYRKRSGPMTMFLLKLSLVFAYLIRSIVLLVSGKWRQSAAFLHLATKVLQ